MAEVLVLAELNPAGGGVRKTTLEALTAARALGEPSAVVIAAPGTAAGIKDALAEYGAATVYVAEAPEVDEFLVAPKAEVLAQLVQEKSPAAVVVPSSPEGKEIAARLAIKVGSGFLTDVTEIAADGTATQAVFAGAVIVHSKVTTGTPIYTLRGNSVTPEPAPAAGATRTMMAFLLAAFYVNAASWLGTRPKRPAALSTNAFSASASCDSPNQPPAASAASISARMRSRSNLRTRDMVAAPQSQKVQENGQPRLVSHRPIQLSLGLAAMIESNAPSRKGDGISARSVTHSMRPVFSNCCIPIL